MVRGVGGTVPRGEEQPGGAGFGRNARGAGAEGSAGDDLGGVHLSDPVALAKALTAYAKTNPSFTFKAGIVEGRVIDIKAIGDLANLPSKEEIFAKLLYLINAPAQRLAMAINAVGRNLAAVVDQGVKENKFRRRGQAARRNDDY